ncbi:hypothetical protein CN975_28735 [Bacillus cereus]|nr:hypothetical protein CN477_00115 [Bacillus cereus]PFB99393.1 hypothetical protein CN280_25345 [Bacillus cereus]PFF14258.1 hypothetical protein CN343_12505 [Bacillus cereus]PFK23183.1 hypothetical protein COJ03_11320 [Bacillus cereus]PGK15972.1 hypothetical protein CN895_06025 [Bacillus cereus]
MKKDKIGEYDLILSIREKQVTQTILIFMILYFLLIFDIKPMFSIYIYIEKFITNLVGNVFSNESKLYTDPPDILKNRNKSIHWKY